MEFVFYYFLKRAIDDEPIKNPICSDSFLGDVGEFIERDGVGFIIVDFAVEKNIMEFPEEW